MPNDSTTGQMTLHTIPPHRRAVLRPLFSTHAHLTTVIEAVLRGNQGTAVANHPTQPTAARLDMGFTFLGGAANAPHAHALLERASDIFVWPDEAWRSQLSQRFGPRAVVMPRWACHATSFDRTHLQQLAQRLPDKIRIVPLDWRLAQRIGPALDESLVDNFASLEDFMIQGFGVCALLGDQIVCGASTFAVAHPHVEIQINTHPDFQRRGLATAVAATFILHCLDTGWHPHWDAHNQASARLAERLGYAVVETYETYTIQVEQG